MKRTDGENLNFRVPFDFQKYVDPDRVLRSPGRKEYIFAEDIRKRLIEEDIEATFAAAWQEHEANCKEQLSKPSDQDRVVIKERVSQLCNQIDLHRRIRRVLFEYSERTLELLRSRRAHSPPDPELLREAYKRYLTNLPLENFPEANPDSPHYVLKGPKTLATRYQPKDVVNPNDYFEQSLPDLVRNFGLPFHSTVPRVTMNEDDAFKETIEGFDLKRYVLPVVLTDAKDDGGLFGFRF